MFLITSAHNKENPDITIGVMQNTDQNTYSRNINKGTGMTQMDKCKDKEGGTDQIDSLNRESKQEWMTEQLFDFVGWSFSLGVFQFSYFHSVDNVICLW